MDNIVDTYTAAEIWEKGNNLKIFRGKASSKEELEKEWQEFESEMTPEQQMQSDDESIRLFGKTNLERFKELHKRFDNESINESSYIDNEYEIVDDEDILDNCDEEIEQAKQYMNDMNTVIMYPTKTLEDLEDLYNRMMSEVSPDDIINNDNKTIELFGYTNDELYQKCKSNFLKAHYDLEEGLNRISLHNKTNILLATSATDSIIKEYLDICNFEDQPITSICEVDMNIVNIADKLSSLLEYTPVRALDDIINSNPMPMYLPKEIETDPIDINPNMESVSRFNEFFDNLYQGFSNEEDIIAYQKEWYNTVQQLQSEYNILKNNTSVRYYYDDNYIPQYDISQDIITEDLRQTIFNLGWHPDYDISKVTNWNEINTNTLNQIKERYYGNNKIINLCELMTLIDNIKGNNDENLKPERRKNLNPVYIVLSAGIKNSSNIIKWWTKGPFSHAAIGLNYDLETIYSYNNAGGEHQGLSIEGMSFFHPEQRIAVYSIFVDDEDMIALKKNIEFYVNNKDKTHYSKFNIVTLVLNKSVNFQYDMICSQFVDRLLKFINININDKDSALVSPNDFYRAAATNTKIYKLYDGKSKNYKPEKIKKVIDRLLYSDKTKCFKEFSEILYEVGAKLLKNKKTSTDYPVPTEFKHAIKTNHKGLVSDDYHKAIQQHSMELTADDIEEFERLLAIDIEQEPDKLVKEFNAWINKEFEKIEPILNTNDEDDLKRVRSKMLDDKYNDETGINYILSMKQDMLALKYSGMKDKEIKDILKKDYFLVEEDPYKLRRELQFRVNYNKKMIKIFKNLLKKNYMILQSSEAEADMIQSFFSSNIDKNEYLAIRMIKSLLNRSANNFMINHNVYDLRSIDLGGKYHAGVICISNDGVNGNFEALSRLVQKSLEWDVIIYSHGNTQPIIDGINNYRSSMNEILNNKLEDHIEDFDNFVDNMKHYMYHYESHKSYAEGIHDAINTLFKFQYIDTMVGIEDVIIKCKTTAVDYILKKLISDKPKTVDGIEASLLKSSEHALELIIRDIELILPKNIDKDEEDYIESMDRMKKEFIQTVLLYACQLQALDDYLVNHSDWMWVTQDIYSTKAGPFKTMNELLRQLIFKEGFKKILIFTCNPGGHDLPDDIKNANVVIKYGDVTNLTEEDNISKVFDDCFNTIQLVENNLIRECEKYDIDYNDDEYLLECYNKLESNIELLSEKASDKPNGWENVSKFINEIIIGLTYKFKELLNFFKFVLFKMRNFFRNIVNHNKFAKPIKTEFIYINNGKAKLKASKVSSYNELEKEATLACKSITDSVIEYQKDNMKVYNRFGKYVKDKSGKSNKIHEQEFIDNIFDYLSQDIIQEAKRFPDDILLQYKDVIIEGVNKLQGINSPEDLYDYLKHFDYGFVLNGKPTKFTGKNDNEYRTISPNDYIKYQTGTCYDSSEYIMLYLDKYFKELKPKMYYLEYKDNNDRVTHSWVSFTDKSKVYVIEASWGSFKGVHEFNNESEMLNYYIDNLAKENDYIVFQVNPINRYGLNYADYMIDRWKTGRLIKKKGDHKCPDSDYQAVTESNSSDHFYFYHLVPKGSDMRNGLVSLEWQYYNDKKSFKKNSDKYRDRICNGWNLSDKNPKDLTDQEILSALNTFRNDKHGANKIYFFKYPPTELLGDNMKELLKYKDIYRIDLYDDNTRRCIEDIDWGYNGSYTGNEKLNEKWYKDISQKDYFSKYSDDDIPLFSSLNHIGITPKNMRIPLSCLTKITDIESITEAKEFPVQFDKDGNLLIKNYKKMDYNKEYQRSHELLKTYDKAKAIDAMKYELARLWFVNTVITAHIYDNKEINTETKKDYMKIRAWIMNDFTKYNKVVSSVDKEFNFSEYYNTTPFSDVYIQINSSTVKFLGNLLKLIVKR